MAPLSVLGPTCSTSTIRNSSRLSTAQMANGSR
jgi:hypothetical protein